MPVSPSSISFDYEKGGSLPSTQNVNLTPNDNNDYFGDGPWVDGKPYWLSVVKYQETQRPAVARYRFGLINSQVRNLGVGLHTGQVVFLYKRLSGRLAREYVSIALEVTAPPPPPDPPEFVNVTYSAFAANTCNEISVRFEIGGGTPPYRLILNNQYQSGSFSSPHTIQIPRNGTPSQAVIIDSNNNRISVTPTTSQTATTLVGPRRLLSSDIDITVRNYSLGSTASVTVTYFNNQITPYEYSLDGNVWQSESSFSDLEPDTYTMYVRDALGCVTTKQFIVDGVTELTETVFSISEINPMRFAQEDSYKKNYYNTLSFMEAREIHNSYVQKWLNDDVVPTQFRTNAQYINVYAIDCNDNETPIFVQQRTQNIGRIGYSTVTLFSSPLGRGALYFGLVDLLNPDTDAVVETLDYLSILPSWITEGQEVEVAGVGYASVERIYFSETYKAYIAELDIAYGGSGSERTVKTVYNSQPYEIYEFETVITAMPDRFQIVIEAGVSNSQIDFRVISESQQKFTDEENYLYIQYSDPNNRGTMNYQTGIKPFIRLEAYPNYEGEQETSGYNGDQQYYKINDEIYNTHSIRFPYLSSAMAHKLRLVVSHNMLLINNVKCTLAESPEVEGEETTNYKQLTALFKLTGNEFIPGGSQNIIDTGNGLSGIEVYKDLGLLIWTKNTA